MMNDNQEISKPQAPPRKRLRRWLRGVLITAGVLLGLLLCAFLLMRFAYPAYLQSRLPADAPRIAFSLDNTLLGKIGITDASYVRVIAAAGGRLIKFRPDMAGDPNVDPDRVKMLLEEKEIDAVLLAGGGDVDPALYGGDPNTVMLVHRLRDDFEIPLVRAARDKGLPILGICRGCQLINVALGGTIRNLRKEPDVAERHMVLTGHPVSIEPDSNLGRTLGVAAIAKAVSLHGNCVAEPGEGVRIIAAGPEDVPEAIEADSPGGKGWILGIQWHPELTYDDKVQHKIYRVFVDRARESRRQR
ncbi:MAG: gamma-glutamyl-gamma-aminobutyrate hydrolase family protein [Planctomycetota bacterium]|jgi:putative glutamine amidotransferase